MWSLRWAMCIVPNDVFVFLPRHTANRWRKQVDKLWCSQTVSKVTWTARQSPILSKWRNPGWSSLTFSSCHNNISAVLIVQLADTDVCSRLCQMLFLSFGSAEASAGHIFFHKCDIYIFCPFCFCYCCCMSESIGLRYRSAGWCLLPRLPGGFLGQQHCTAQIHLVQAANSDRIGQRA